jgi:polar amino acid transport system substrate-binding protein
MYARLVTTLFLLCLLSGPVSAKELIFAVDPTYPPLEMLDDDQQVIGLTADLVAALAKAQGFRYKFKHVPWGNIFSDLAGGGCDAIASSVSITKDRQKRMDFTDPYLLDVKQGVLVHKDSPIKSKDDLKGKILASQEGTTGLLVAKQISASGLDLFKSIERYGLGYFTGKKILRGEAKAYNLVEQAVVDLSHGLVDAVLFDEPVAMDYVRQKKYSEQLSVAFLITPPEPGYLGIAVRKGDDATRELLNEGLKKIRENGEYDAILTKWLEASHKG